MQPGATVAGHRVERQLGDNGFASTWLVRAPSGEPRVLRTLQLFLPAYQERFRRSSEVLVGVQHPHLVRVAQVVQLEVGVGALVEFVEGGHLGAWIARGPHPPAAILVMLRGILSGVAAAHGLGLLHRNLKPSMVLLGPGEVPKVDDFALGKVTLAEAGDQKLTQMGTTFGTPQYMSPEQFRGAQNVDARADLFSVGCLAYEMCTGRRPFDGTDVIALYTSVAQGRYAPIATLRADLPPALVRLIDDLMRPDPAARPASAQAVLDRIDADPELSALLPQPPPPRPSAPATPASSTPVARPVVPIVSRSPAARPAAPAVQAVPAARRGGVTTAPPAGDDLPTVALPRQAPASMDGGTKILVGLLGAAVLLLLVLVGVLLVLVASL